MANIYLQAKFDANRSGLVQIHLLVYFQNGTAVHHPEFVILHLGPPMTSFLMGFIFPATDVIILSAMTDICSFTVSPIWLESTCSHCFWADFGAY